MSATTTAEGDSSKTERPLYKVGDYITRPDYVKFKVVAVIADNPANPLYGLWHPKKNDIIWETQFMTMRDKLKRTTFDVRRWSSLAAGDLVNAGERGKSSVVTVIARVGDAVMLSMQPTPRKVKQSLDRIAAQIEELSDGEVTVDDIKKVAGLNDSPSEAFKSTGDKWFTLEQLEYMNWEPLIGDE